MGIRFSCPNGHNLNVKAFLAGKRAICPHCGMKVMVPDLPESEAAAQAPPAAPLAVPLPPVEPRASATTTQDTITSSTPSVEIATVEAALLPGTRQSVPPPVGSEAAPLPPPSPVAEVAVAEGATRSAPTEPIAVSAEAAYNMQRARARRNQVRITVALLVLIVILAVALCWVLWNGTGALAPSHSLHRQTTLTRLATHSINPDMVPS